MATFTVDAFSDNPSDGRLSLREAVALSNASAETDTIQFASSLEGRTLFIHRSELAVTGDVIIDGDRDNDGREVTLGGFHKTTPRHPAVPHHRRRHRCPPARPDLGGRLHLRHAANPNGGAILLGGGSLSLDGCTLRDNEATKSGGAIYADDGSRLSITDSSLRSAIRGVPIVGYGSAIGTGEGATLAIRRSIIDGNWRPYGAVAT